MAKTEAMATTGAHGHDRITVSPDSEGHKCIKYTDVLSTLALRYMPRAGVSTRSHIGLTQRVKLFGG